MITFKAKRFRAFFNSKALKDHLGKKRHNFLRKVGGYARKVARNSMKRMGKARKPPKNMKGKAYLKWLDEIKNMPASPPGQPPFAHSDSDRETLKWIEFEFASKESVIVGPIGLNGAARTVPALHEYGGSQGIREKMIGRKWFPQGRTQPRPGQPSRRRMAKYPARPFMKPAVKTTNDRWKTLWVTS